MIRTCQVCGYPIRLAGGESIVECQRCGSVYDVVVHGRRIEAPDIGYVEAQTYPTRQIFYMQYPGTVSQVPDGTKFYVGDKIKIRAVLEYQGADGVWRWVTGDKMGANLRVLHRVDTGSWEVIFEGKPPAGSGYFDNEYTFTKTGRHSFTVAYPGDSIYSPCPPASSMHVKVAPRRIEAPEAGEVIVPPPIPVETTLMVHVVDMVTRSSIADAKVTVDTAEATTDETGTATFKLAPGSVLIKASKPGYVEASKRIELTEAGATEELALIPIWVFPVGILAVGGLILLGTKALKWW
jgi:hypothetical protein